MSPTGPPGWADVMSAGHPARPGAAVWPADAVRFMREALALAARGRGLTSPNPMVGALVVADGAVVGVGFHARAGGPHAEIEALAAAGDRARGATLYVTLEPCAHTGRTPPCVDAVLRAGIRRVVAATRDPNPRVNGAGLAALAAGGVETAVGCLGAEASALNRPFFTAMTRCRPHITWKCAMSLDGKIAAVDGVSRWITGPEARREAHRLRSESDAVVVGIGTALADDPALDVRLEAPWPREPLRLVVDSAARLPLEARLIAAGAPARAMVAVTDTAPPERVAALEGAGVSVLRVKADRGRVDLADLCARLFALEVRAVVVEGGSTLAGSFVDAGLVDRVVCFVAPVLVGGAAALGAVGGAGRPLGRALRLERLTARPVGADWLLEGNVIDHGDAGEEA
ncbi:MAG: bifunctional diaminohydroxyphosphoribosylaminopyrimidine deaminase/5-amino-6-(5-phosphoribosylamino)uracil reductase RibD [Candidatus Rokubacteria bacterium]|nr:bifunctional diaminohydroxyphosphoribosylaminopyrimidine deaminase/5-amino-6-(5-phosphoribosylamino)uracil reductase RibD [Candidatus Rokubacteria bacterium]